MSAQMLNVNGVNPNFRANWGARKTKVAAQVEKGMDHIQNRKDINFDAIAKFCYRFAKPNLFERIFIKYNQKQVAKNAPSYKDVLKNLFSK